MKTIRQMGWMLTATLLVASTLGCRSGSKSSLSQTPMPDPTSSIAAGQKSFTPQYYSGGPQTLPMRSDQSYANDVVSIAKKDKLVTHQPPTPMRTQGSGSRPY